MMRRSDMPDEVFVIGPDTIETAFPVSGTTDRTLLPEIAVEVWDLAACKGSTRVSYNDGWRPTPKPCVVFPQYPPSIYERFDDGLARIGPVDCDGVGGSFLLPVCHDVPNHWPPPAIPVVDDAPVRGRTHSRTPVLVYPAFRFDEFGRLAVRWDRQLHALPQGRYEVRVTLFGNVCGTFEMDKTHGCIDLGSAVSRDLKEPPERGPRPEGITDMFDAIDTWTSTTTCQLNAGDTSVGVVDADLLCGATLCVAPELVISDGVTREIVKFQGCADGKLLIERSQAATIQAGAIIRFEWTAGNTRIACEGCP